MAALPTISRVLPGLQHSGCFGRRRVCSPDEFSEPKEHLKASLKSKAEKPAPFRGDGGGLKCLRIPICTDRRGSHSEIFFRCARDFGNSNDNQNNQSPMASGFLESDMREQLHLFSPHGGGGPTNVRGLQSPDRWRAAQTFAAISENIFLEGRGAVKSLEPFDPGPAAKDKNSGALIGAKTFFWSTAPFPFGRNFVAKFTMGGSR